jgi:VWFA-related protein
MSTRQDRGIGCRTGCRAKHLAVSALTALAAAVALLSASLSARPALGQSAGPVALVRRVDSQDFPSVTARVSVYGTTGVPVGDLASAAWAVEEDGKLVPSQSVSVERDDTAGFNVAFGIDTSVEPLALSQVISAVNTFADGMGTADSAALIEFSNEPKLDQDFAIGKEPLKAALGKLVVGGGYTALYDAAIDALSRAEGLPPGARAIVLFTNSGDNVNRATLEDVTGRAKIARVPIYIVGFSVAAQNANLTTLAESTGGRAYLVAKIEDAQSGLTELATILRRGYKLTFQAASRADGAEHKLIVRATTTEGAAEAQSRFVATSSPVKVELPDLKGGQVVWAAIKLAPKITARMPVAAVEYLLDGTSLIKVAMAPFAYDWDPKTASPGTHTLSVKAVDSAGNEGVLEVKVSVPQPMQIALAVPVTQAWLGSVITVDVKVVSAVNISSVALLADGRAVATRTAAPYQFIVDTTGYTVGKRLLAARAVDVLGREGEDSRSVELRAPVAVSATAPLGPPAWLRWALAVLATLAVIGAIAMVPYVVRAQKRAQQRVCILEVANAGNVPSRYEIWPADPTQSLSFKFRLAGAELTQFNVAMTAESLVVGGERVEGEGGARGSRLAGTAGRVKAAAGDVTSRQEKVQAGMEKVQTISATLSDLLIQLSKNVSPRLAQPMRAIALRLTHTGKAAAVAISDPTAALKEVDNAAVRQVARAGETAIEAKDAVGEIGTTALGSGEAKGERVDPEEIARRHSGRKRRPTQEVDENPVLSVGHVQTPAVNAGELLALDLLIDPINPYRRQEYSFHMVSRSMEQPDADVVATEGRLKVAGLSGLRRFYPFLVACSVVVVMLALVALLAFNPGVLGL